MFVQSRYVIGIGTAMIGTALIGKSSIHFYRLMKQGKAFARPSKVGQYYQGGFEKTMTGREASLILGVKYVYEVVDKLMILFVQRVRRGE